MAEPASAEQLADAVLAGPARLGDVRLVTVDGPSGSGKSTVGIRLRNALAARGRRVALVPTDHFATWEDPFGWWPALETGVLVPFAQGRPGRYVAVDWSTGSAVRNRPITVPVPEVLILEGVSAGRASTVGRATLAVWVELADRAARLERAVARDGEAIREPLRVWQDAEDAWFIEDDASGRAQVRLDGSG